MSIKLHEPIIDKKKPFDKCKLDREPCAKILTEIVGSYADGFVLAVNNQWGAGKTTFVKMWQQYLNNQEFQTIYFNAWENDFDNSPLVALMSELKSLINNDIDKKAFKRLLEKGAVFIKNMAPAIVKAVAERYIDTKVITEFIENFSQASVKILEKEVKEYTNKKENIRDFKEALEKFVKQSNNNKPLVFIIDELDRCRPNYAVEVLEQVKHFFSVRGIVFVLSIDKKHLASSVKGFYGSDRIDADEYLRRFIDLEYSIPEPSTEKFVEYLFEQFGFEDSFLLSKDTNGFLRMAKFLFDKTKATLRQQEKIFALTRLVLHCFKRNETIIPHLLFFLIYLKTMKNDFYKQIEKKELTFQELNDEFEKLMYSSTEEKYLRESDGYVQFLLLLFYSNNEKNQFSRKEPFDTDESGNPTMSITSRINQKELPKYFGYIARDQYLPLKYLTDKINLTESIKKQ